ncbi:uncharacterized protein LOC132199632 isoform X2 [Neocloeon triangulifer]|uniref:uncharacterized protein LOC132199632 isoform X2 n=1 Tax=Neocloeon triangulifer TaxID=2078957 RepID=UPI00286FA730|nr:uncharacterized protein LOC132199632 isoform X2 [Neocloeon triangulifer]
MFKLSGCHTQACKICHCSLAWRVLLSSARVSNFEIEPNLFLCKCIYCPHAVVLFPKSHPGSKELVLAKCKQLQLGTTEMKLAHCRVSVLVIVLIAITPRDAVGKQDEFLLGFDCDEERSCQALNEHCDAGFCKCKPGFVRNALHCFPARNYGESCFFDVQCSVFPLICADHDGTGVKRCDCHKFFTWDKNTEECHHSENISAMVSKLEQKWDYEARIDEDAKSVFPGIVAAGIMVLVIGAVMATACTIYGCYSGSWKCLSRREKRSITLTKEEPEKTSKKLEKIEATDVPLSSDPVQEV